MHVCSERSTQETLNYENYNSTVLKQMQVKNHDKNTFFQIFYKTFVRL